VQTFRLWPGDAPGAVGETDADVPKLSLYLPRKPSGASIVVCPGGGYGHLAEHEGDHVARFFCSLGIAGAVLQYRLGPRYRHPNMLLDVTRAMRTTRARAAEWGLDPTRVGIKGSSAGGHLAATACTHFDAGDPQAQDPIERAGSRPDLAVLLYPVITMMTFTHGGSRANLLGDSADPKVVEDLSNERRVTKFTPPMFIFHTVDDPAVPVENAMDYASALRKAGVSFEMHLYEKGRHGVGLAPDNPVLNTWPALCAGWLRAHGFCG
jgi:acetyl esterase/lipase